MSRISPLHFMNAALVFGVMLAVTDAVAQQSPTSGGSSSGSGKLVYTACEQGQVTKCGSKPASENCTFSIQVDLNMLAKSGGFSFGGYVCTPVGNMDLFKDFHEDTRSGSCYLLPRTAADGSRTRKGSEDDNGDSSEGGLTESSC